MAVILKTFNFEMTLDFIAKNSKEFTYILHSASPNVNNLLNHITVIKSRKLTCFPPNVLSLFRGL